MSWKSLNLRTYIMVQQLLDCNNTVVEVKRKVKKEVERQKQYQLVVSKVVEFVDEETEYKQYWVNFLRQ